jgi:hypothetical protein
MTLEYTGVFKKKFAFSFSFFPMFMFVNFKRSFNISFGWLCFTWLLMIDKK